MKKIMGTPTAPTEVVEKVMTAFAEQMGYLDCERLVERYLDGRSVKPSIGRQGIWGFEHMMRALGREPPKARGR